MCIYLEPKYCVYLTVYYGNKLPPFYIGSTSISRVKSGYRGSVKSKKYKNVFQKELQENPHLFKTKIVASYYSRKNAQFKEKRLQTKLNVVKSDLYINMSIAKNFGWFGMKSSKEHSPTFGKRWKKTQEQIERSRVASKNAFNRPEIKEAMSKQRKGKLPMSNKQKHQLIESYRRIFDLYNSKPDLRHGFVAKNGKMMTYERAFAKHYHEMFNKTVNGLYQILTGKRIGVDLI